MTMTRPTLKRHLQLLGGAALLMPLLGCVTVESPDKPIEINLNVDIRQEVLVRLQQDAERIIRDNPDAFPTNPGQ